MLRLKLKLAPRGFQPVVSFAVVARALAARSTPPLCVRNTTHEAIMELGAIFLSLAVKDIEASKFLSLHIQPGYHIMLATFERNRASKPRFA